MPGMPIVEKHAPGDFCWMELATTDHAGAKKFYSELFAWSFTESPIGQMSSTPCSRWTAAM